MFKFLVFTIKPCPNVCWLFLIHMISSSVNVEFALFPWACCVILWIWEILWKFSIFMNCIKDFMSVICLTLWLFRKLSFSENNLLVVF
jgi:hypothetical protein